MPVPTLFQVERGQTLVTNAITHPALVKDEKNNNKE